MFNYHFEHNTLELSQLLCFGSREPAVSGAALCWRAKCLRLGEVDAIDDRTHPAHAIPVTARGWPPGRPAHLTPGAGHPPAADVGSQLAAIPAQATIALWLASAHGSATFRIPAAAMRQPPWRPRQRAYLTEGRPSPLIHPGSGGPDEDHAGEGGNEDLVAVDRRRGEAV